MQQLRSGDGGQGWTETTTAIQSLRSGEPAHFEARKSAASHDFWQTFWRCLMAGQRGQRMSLEKRLRKALESGGRLTLRPDEVRWVAELFGLSSASDGNPKGGDGEAGSVAKP